MGQTAGRCRDSKDIAEALPDDVWQRLSAGDGTKDARLHDWVYLELADLDADDFDAAFPGIWTRGLLTRRKIADGDLAFFSTWCPVGHGKAGDRGGPPLGHRRQLRNRQERVRP